MMWTFLAGLLSVGNQMQRFSDALQANLLIICDAFWFSAGSFEERGNICIVF